MKKCTKCGKQKPFSEFHLKRGKPRSQCKACEAKYFQRWQGENTEKRSEYSRRWYKTNRFRAALKDSRVKAKKRGHAPCFATPEQLEAVYTGFCHHCGKSEKKNGKRLALDHCHETGKFRGFLCDICNFKDVFASLSEI